MKKALLVMALAALVAAPAFADLPVTMQISIGLRETGSTAAIGENGGTSGSIEWVDLDGQMLILDGTWQQFTFDLDQAAITGFTGNGILDGAAGTLEHIRVRSNGYRLPFQLWVDDLADTYKPNALSPPVTTLLGGGWEAPWLPGDSVILQEPGFSGSSTAHLVPGSGALGEVTDAEAYSGTQSYALGMQFVDGATSHWARVTTFQGTDHNLPNPTVYFDRDSVISFWMKGVPEPTSLALLGLGAAAILRRRR